MVEPTTLLLNKNRIEFKGEHSLDEWERKNRWDDNSFSDYQRAVVNAGSGKREMSDVPV